MSIIVATLCLNEMEWLPKLVQQHIKWPKMIRWVFVESADIVYAQCNPTRVTQDGLSVDGTSQFLQELSERDERVIYIPHGFCGGKNAAMDQGKCEARNRYLEVADDFEPELLVVLDSDEFYTYQHQLAISNIIKTTSSNKIDPRFQYKGYSFCFKQRHIWYPPFLQNESNYHKYPQYKFLSHEAIGGYWDVIHCRIWKWEKGIRYINNHNWPQTKQGELLTYKGQSMLRTDQRIPLSLKHQIVPECIHFGFASSLISRQAKHRYYEERGEGQEQDILRRRLRKMYVECRNEYRAWEPSTILPHHARIIQYKGPIPECFIENQIH